ncbi:hypothetical protein BG004_007836 [Podila humilis]|nr:hypothetical protein BG004_007836 [Podila humilis]
MLDIPARTSMLTEIRRDQVLDPAEEVLRQKRHGDIPRRHRDHGATWNSKAKEKTRHDSVHLEQQQQEQPKPVSSLGMPTLGEAYAAIVRANELPLTEESTLHGPGSRDQTLTLSSIYMDYSGPLLRRFLNGWVKTTTAPGGFGSIVGKRNFGNMEVPSVQQWIAGYLGTCEALGITLSLPRSKANRQSTGTGGNSVDEDEICSTLGKASLSTKSGNTTRSANSVSGRDSRDISSCGSRRSGNGKRYSQRCTNLVQKRIRDFVQGDEVMEELYGQKQELNTTRSHSDRYHQIKADQATKLFQSLAHRR